jgi:hypothetical protein
MPIAEVATNVREAVIILLISPLRYEGVAYRLVKFWSPISPFGSIKALRTTEKTGSRTKTESRISAIKRSERENLSIERKFFNFMSNQSLRFSNLFNLTNPQTY